MAVPKKCVTPKSVIFVTCLMVSNTIRMGILWKVWKTPCGNATSPDRYLKKLMEPKSCNRFCCNAIAKTQNEQIHSELDKENDKTVSEHGNPQTLTKN
eukprot:2865029-Amphidinium_carterae.1